MLYGLINQQKKNTVWLLISKKKSTFWIWRWKGLGSLQLLCRFTNVKPSIDHYAFHESFHDCIVSNAHNTRCILANTGSLIYNPTFTWLIILHLHVKITVKMFKDPQQGDFPQEGIKSILSFNFTGWLSSWCTKHHCWLRPYSRGCHIWTHGHPQSIIHWINWGTIPCSEVQSL